MKHYIIASHKHLGEGFYSAVKAIVGDVDSVHIISAYVDHHDLTQEIMMCLEGIPLEDDLVVMTDIYGGSVNTEFMKLLGSRDFHLIAGVNLALIISIMVEIQGPITREELIEKIEECRMTLRYCNDDLVGTDIEEEF